MSLLLIFVGTIICWATYLIGQGTNQAAMVASVVFFLTAIALYFAPGFVAASRRHPNTNANAIVVLNALLGWTLLGWIAALVWSYSAISKETDRDDEVVVDDGYRNCPMCAEPIRKQAIKCRHCMSEVAPST